MHKGFFFSSTQSSCFSTRQYNQHPTYLLSRSESSGGAYKSKEKSSGLHDEY